MFDDVADLYQDAILRHSRDPLHHVSLEPFDAEAQGDNPMCGDRCTVRLRFGPNGNVARAGFQARGCAISLASADMMAQAARGKSPAALRLLAQDVTAMTQGGDASATLGELRALSGVAAYPSRIKCATLPWAALVAALDGAKEASSE